MKYSFKVKPPFFRLWSFLFLICIVFWLNIVKKKYFEEFAGQIFLAEVQCSIWLSIFSPTELRNQDEIRWSWRFHFVYLRFKVCAVYDEEILVVVVLLRFVFGWISKVVLSMDQQNSQDHRLTILWEFEISKGWNCHLLILPQRFCFQNWRSMRWMMIH